MVRISPDATALCGVGQTPVPFDVLCFVNAKDGLEFIFNLIEQ